MSPALEIGDRTWTNPWETPKEGDILEFKCLSEERCGAEYAWKNRLETITHRWVSTDPDGCMHIIGDNPNIEWDKNFCLMPDEIEILGVVHKLPF